MILGTGNYPNVDENLKSIEKSGTEILTIAVRRVNNENLKNFLVLNKIINLQLHYHHLLSSFNPYFISLYNCQ